MEKIFDIAKDSEQKWGVIAQGIDGNFEELSSKVTDIRTDVDNMRGYSLKDFTISDENGYDIVQFEDGHVKTKKFDSSNLAKSVNDIFYTHAPKTCFPYVNLQKDHLRILDIGNSFTGDATRYLSSMASAATLDVSDMCLYFLHRGAGSFKSWYDCWNDADTYDYYIFNRLGSLSLDISLTQNDKAEAMGAAAECDAGDGTLMRTILKEQKWDLIIIHQETEYFGDYDAWSGNSEKGYLNELLRIIKTYQPQACVGTLLIHSSWNMSGGDTEKAFADNALSIKRLKQDYGIDFIIPYGCAVQNIRNSVLNTSTHGMCYDGHHLGLGLAHYAANSAYYEKVVAPRYGKSILGNSYRVTSIGGTYAYPDANILVDTDAIAYTAQIAGILAVSDMYNVTNPDNINI